MEWATNLLKDLKTLYVNHLSEVYDSREAAALFHILAEAYTGKTPIDIQLNPEIRISESEMLKLHKAVKRLLKSEPIQYILGYTVFRDLKILCEPGVLIPRPETEELVDLVLKNIQPGSRILDIGTGTGCIPISIKKQMPASTITGIDINPLAIELAKKNAEINRTEIHFQLADLFKFSKLSELANFDVVISNPPYVTESDKQQMHANVLDYEPGSALFVTDEDPLLYYEKIISLVAESVKPIKVFFEINERMGSQIGEMAVSKGLSNPQIVQDIHQKDRFVIVDCQLSK